MNWGLLSVCILWGIPCLAKITLSFNSLFICSFPHHSYFVVPTVIVNGKQLLIVLKEGDLENKAQYPPTVLRVAVYCRLALEGLLSSQCDNLGMFCNISLPLSPCAATILFYVDYVLSLPHLNVLHALVSTHNVSASSEWQFKNLSINLPTAHISGVMAAV